jgi:L-asparaginase type II
VIAGGVPAVIFALLLAPRPSTASPPPAPRVLIVATGGTIANDPAGRLTPQQLVERLPGRRWLGRIETESFANASSASLPLDVWVRLSHHLVERFARDDPPDGIVVTGGTDTLEELAWFLHLTVPGPRPVVLVGAMRRPGAAGEDGPANLADAVRVAAARRSRGRGALVVMHGQIHSARAVRKHHSTSLSAFDEPAGRSAGTIRDGRVIYRALPRPAPLWGALQVPADASLPRVDIFMTYQGAAGDLIEYAAAHGARGLVLAAAGAGSLTPAQAEAARRLAQAGTPVVIASRTGEGDVGLFDADDEAVIAAGSLSAVKARLLLMLAITSDESPAGIARLFARVAR